MTRVHAVHVANADKTLAVPAQSTILDAAESAALPFPRGCRVGRCGACKSRLLSGEVELLPHTPFSLTALEREQGMILACRAQPRSDCSVAWLGSDTEQHPLREVIGRVVSKERPVPDVTVLRIAPEGAPFAFQPGQYAELSFDGGPARPYSMASHPSDGVLEFHIRWMKGGLVSGHVARSVGIGDEVRLFGPMGGAHLRLRRPGPIVAVAGGTGLAPILSILRMAAGLRLRQPIHLFRLASDEAAFYGQADIDTLAASLARFACHRLVGPRRERLASLSARLPELTGATAYVAGSPELADAASGVLTAGGLPGEHIFADAFTTRSDLAQMSPSGASALLPQPVAASR